MIVTALARKGNKITDFSSLITSLSWTTEIEEQPGKLDIEHIDDGKTYLEEGTLITIAIDKVGMFKGYVFGRERSSGSNISITAYDQMRYLQNKDTVNMPQMTASEIFTKICKEQQLNYKVVHPSNYTVASRLHDNKSYYEMINSAILDTRDATGKWYMIRDNFGVLEFVEIKNLLTKLILGDGSLVMDFSFKSNIDEDTYNQIKLTKDNKKTGKRDVYMTRDIKNINNWGRLQFYESVEENANEAQIKQKLDMILKLKNRPLRTLSLECLGDKRIRAGNGFILSIQALNNEKVPHRQAALVKSSTHKIENNTHTMSLEIEVV